MSAKPRLDQLTYVSLDPNPLVSDDDPLYRSAYGLWHSVWQATFRQLKVERHLFSDEFTRQTSLGCFAMKDRCVGLILFREDTAKSPTAFADSALKIWPKDLLKNKIPGRFLLGSYVTVHPLYRGRCPEHGVAIKDLIVEFSVRTLLESSCELLLGSMRKDRGLHQQAQKTGARSLGASATVFGVETEFFTWSRKGLKTQRLFSPLGEKIWHQRTVRKSHFNYAKAG